MSDTNDSHNDDPIVSGKDIHKASDAFVKDVSKGLANADPDAVEKLPIIGEVDAGLAQFLKSGYNIATGLLSPKVTELSYLGASKLGEKAGLSGNTLTRTAAVSAVAVDVAMKTGMYIGPFFNQWKEDAKKKKDLALKISTVLDDKIGKHSVGALSAASHDNEMIKVQLAHYNKAASLQRSNLVFDTLVNAGPNVLMGLFTRSGRMLKGAWNDPSFTPKAFNEAEALALAQKSGQTHVVTSDPMMTAQGFVNSMTGPLSNRMRMKNNRKLEKLKSDYTAMDMVLTLQDQIEHNPKARTFQMPGRSGKSCDLEEYIMRVMITHQENMSALSADHTVLRPALKDEIAAAAKPIAEAIRKGDISALQLITLVGERQVIKSNGRAIASPEEVEDYIDRSAEKPAAAHHVDAKEWVKEASFTPVELKAALKGLHGEERENFAGMFPDSVLEKAGLSVKEVTQIRESIAQRYEPMLMECLLGLAKRTDEELKKEGLASHEIKQLRSAVTEIEKLGQEAVHSLKAGPTNAHGIERVLTNWSVNNVEYFGRVLDEGKAAKLELDDKPKHISHVEKHGLKASEMHPRHTRGVNDDDTHAERLRTGTHDGHHRG